MRLRFQPESCRKAIRFFIQAACRVGQPSKILIAVNSAVMTIRPRRLDGVASHDVEPVSSKLEAL